MSILDRVLSFFSPVKRAFSVKNALRAVRYGYQEPNIIRLKSQLSFLNEKMLRVKKENRNGSPSAEDYNTFRLLKDEIRYHHLAFNFIINVPYRKIESFCIELPEINKLFPIVLAYKPIFRPYSKFEVREAKNLSDTELYTELFDWLNSSYE